MPQDIRKLFESDKYQNDPQVFKKQMPKGHESRFLEKLNKALPIESKRLKFNFLHLAASIVLLVGFSFGAYQFMVNQEVEEPIVTVTRKSLGDISPQFKKVEDYYLANINLELSKMKVTPESKELFDGYLVKLEELNKEYTNLEEELTITGPNKQNVNALINNLKLRLNLLYRLKEQLGELNESNNTYKDLQV